MKNKILLIIRSVITVSILCSKLTATAQQITPKVIPLNKPQLVNFKALADYQLKHPAEHKYRYIEQGEDKEHGRTFIPHKAPVNSPVFDVTTARTRSGNTTSPPPRNIFNGIISNISVVPPDINGAVGTNYILETTNQEFDILTKNGTLNSVLDIPAFFASQNGTFYFDPHVEYDIAHKRYIIISDGLFNSGSEPSAIFVAVSQTDDPTGNWYTYSFNGFAVDSDDFLDYPLLGYNNSWVVITGNDYISTGAVQVNVWALNRADLYSGVLGTVKEFSIANYISITPTQTYDTTLADDYLVQDDNGDQKGVGYIQIGAVSGTLNNPTVSVGTALGVNSPWNDDGSIGATQEGSPVNIESGLDTKIENSVYRNGSLWLTHTVYLPAASPTHCAVDWWQVNPSPLTTVQFGRLEDPAGIINYYYPSINVDAYNNVLLGYTISSPTMYPSSAYSYRAFTDPQNTLENSYLFQPGVTYYNEASSGRNRWGDFSFTCTDPEDNTFWTFQEFAAGPANTWGTVIANIGSSACNGKPAAGNISTSVDTLCSGDGTILKLTGYTSNVNGVHLQWQQSLTGTNLWTTATGGVGDTTASYSTASLTTTTYFRCIVTCLNSGLADTTSLLKVIIPGVYSVTNDTVCLPGNYNLIANGVGTTFNWYHNGSGGSSFFTGDTLNTTIIKDTTFYINTTLVKHYSAGILNDSVGEGDYFGYTFNDGLLFNAISNFTLDSLYVYPSSTGTVTVNLINTSNGSTLSSVTAAISSSQINKKTAIATNFSCIAGTGYTLTATNTTVRALFRTSAYAAYPYVLPGILSIPGANNLATGHYYYFYDWRVSTTCTSPRIPVNVEVGGLVLKATATPDSICTGSKVDSVLLKVNGATNYTWQPVNTTDSLFYVKPSVSTTYTVTGTDSAGCQGIAAISVFIGNCTEGVNTITSNNSSVQVYPNPTVGQFDIIMNNLPGRVYTLSLYNMLGQKIIEKQVTVSSSYFEVPVNLSSLPAELYLVRVTAGLNEWTERIIKR